MRFGSGEVEPANKKFSINTARTYFLQEIMDNASDVIRDLEKSPLKTYTDARVSPAQLWPITDDKVTLYSFRGIDLQGLRLALRAWARRWNLEADWCLDNICWTLAAWQQLPQQRESWNWSLIGCGWMRLNDDAFSHLNPPFGLAPFEADIEFLEHYFGRSERRIKDHIEQDPFFECTQLQTQKHHCCFSSRQS